MLAVCDGERTYEVLLREIRLRQVDGRLRDVHARYHGPTPGKTCQVDSGPAAHFEDAPAGVLFERDKFQQMVELFEVVLIEVVKEAARSNWMVGDFEVVNVSIPIVANLRDGAHRKTIA